LLSIRYLQSARLSIIANLEEQTVANPQKIIASQEKIKAT
jgi:hypothetical protein